jgi:SAM-dependent methyltransferase
MTAPANSPLSTVGSEALDSPTLDPAVTRATLADIARANRLFGGRGAVVHGVARLLDGASNGGSGGHGEITLLDVGAGMGDIAKHLERRGSNGSPPIRAVALDWHSEAASLCRSTGLTALQGDASSLPFADRSVDIVVASQLLHHFNRPAAVGLVRELDRVARLGVVIADIRRTRLAAAGIWLGAVLLRFHPVSRHDGVVSVQRGYGPAELAALLCEAGVFARVSRRPGFRIVATWRTDNADG